MENHFLGIYSCLSVGPCLFISFRGVLSNYLVPGALGERWKEAGPLVKQNVGFHLPWCSLGASHPHGLPSVVHV